MAMVAPRQALACPFNSLAQLFFVLLCFPVARAEIWDGVESPLPPGLSFQLGDGIFCAHARARLHILDCAHELKA